MSTASFSPKAPAEQVRQFITREFAETMAGKTPSPYLRTHDPAQRKLAEFTASPDGHTPQWQAYVESTIHFWREVSLAALSRTGRGADECYALLFESVFDLAQSRPEWAAEKLTNLQSQEIAWRALRQLAHETVGRDLSHAGLMASFSARNLLFTAPRRKRVGRRAVPGSEGVWRPFCSAPLPGTPTSPD